MKKFILLFAVLFLFAQNCFAVEGEYSAKICSASSPEGLNWKHDAKVCLTDAWASSAVVKDGVIYLYYVDAEHPLLLKDTIMCATSKDGINFEEQNMLIGGQITYKAKDPSVIVDKQGKFRLYYLADDPVFTREDKREIHLATSEDGIYFVEQGKVLTAPNISDPEIIFFNNKWFLHVVDNEEGTVLVYTSDDGLKFKPETELFFSSTARPVPIDNNRLRLYTFIPDAGCVIMRSFTSYDGLNWELEKDNRLEAKPNEKMFQVAVVKFQSGYKIFFNVKSRKIDHLILEPAPK